MSRWLFAVLLLVSGLSMQAFAKPSVLFLENMDDKPASQQHLPELGDSASATLTAEEEFRLGRAWLKQLRASAPLVSDPLLQEYIEHLVYRLAAFSDLDNPQLEVIIINSPAINAFAVPGGVLGLNAGLLLSADTEDEAASVIAHELAHLSQRHFVRRYERSKRTNALTLGALLASILIAVNTGGDAGLAAIAGTQAAAIQSNLAYSRQHEREADRVGMQIMAASGMDPYAMPEFFDKLLKKTGLSGDLVPEFVLTHPVTDSRISDSRNRAAQLPHVPAHVSADFLFAKARLQVAFSSNPEKSVAYFRAEAKRKTGLEKDAALYGLALALIKTEAFTDADPVIETLKKHYPQRIAIKVLEAERYSAAQQFDKAGEILRHALAINPNNYPLTLYYAEALIMNNEPERAIYLLQHQALQRPEDPAVWSLLAKAHGKAGDMVGAHRARAELYFLYNQHDRAILQLKYALEKAGDNYQLRSKIKHRVSEINSHKDDIHIID